MHGDIFIASGKHCMCIIIMIFESLLLYPGTTTTASPTTTAVSPTTTASPTTPTTTDNQLGCTCATTAGVTCSDANLSPGCCVCTNSDQAECYVPGGRCHCDAQCFFFGDCCSDVPSSPQCSKKGCIDCPYRSTCPPVLHVSSCTI